MLIFFLQVDVMTVLPCPICPFLAVLSLPSCLTSLPTGLSYPVCPVLAVLSSQFFLVLSCLSFPAVLSRLYCPGYPYLAVPTWLSCLDSAVLAALSWLSCPSYPVLAVASWQSRSGRSVSVKAYQKSVSRKSWLKVADISGAF